MNMVGVILLVVFLSASASAAHYIVGQVENAADSTSPNGRTVVLWNPANGIGDNVTDIVGPSGNSGVSNTYLIDCELLDDPCDINDQINVTLVDDLSGYTAAGPVQVTVTGAGFDLAPNISMNSPPQVVNLTVDDSFATPINEIDLSPAVNTTVRCTGIIVEYDGIATLSNHTSRLYSFNSSFYGDVDDQNYHYTNESCSVNTSYGGSNEAAINCTYQVAYFANAETWECTINVSDNSSASANYSDQTIVNPLLALGVNSTADFGTVDALAVSNDTTIEVVNYGNTLVNLSLSGYGENVSDGYAMRCEGGNISVEELKYNLTDPNPGPMNLSQANALYTNLSASPVNHHFNLSYRTNDSVNDALNNTYWRIHVPIGVHGDCNGTIVFGATQG